MAFPLVVMLQAVTAGCAVIGTGVGVAKAQSSYKLDPRVAIKKQQKDLKEIEYDKSQIAEYEADYAAGKVSQRTYEYWVGLHSRAILRRVEKMQERAEMYSPIKSPPSLGDKIEEYAAL